MLWQAICAVVAVGLLSWFAYVNQVPVKVYGTPKLYADIPVWLVGCVGAALGVLLEFAFTRRLWQAQAAELATARSQLRRARAKVKSQQDAIAERDEKIGFPDAQVEPSSTALVGSEEAGHDGEAESKEDDGEEIGI